MNNHPRATFLYGLWFHFEACTKIIEIHVYSRFIFDENIFYFLKLMCNSVYLALFHFGSGKCLLADEQCIIVYIFTFYTISHRSTNVVK